MTKLSQLIYHLYDTPLYADPEISGLSLDSRQVKPGDLFFACKGTQLDGRQFINDAIKNGAHAVLADVDTQSTHVQTEHQVPILPVDHLAERIGDIAEKFYGNPAKKLKIIGVTGTNGKTSCTYFLGQALAQCNIPCGIIGTLGNGIYGEIKPGNLTTPDPIVLHGLFNEFVKKKIKMVAMEVSSHSLDQGRTNGIEFDIGIFTNLTRDHLDYHGTMEAYAAAKRKLFDPAVSKNAVINIDDEYGRELVKTLNRKNIFTYSISQHCDVYAEQIQVSLAGIHAHVVTPWGRGDLHVPLIGKFNLSNVLAVLTTLCLSDISFTHALTALTHLMPVPGRLQTFGGNTKPLVAVDYAHSPDSLEKVLIALRQHCKGKLFCVFGCGGDRDRGKRPLMAKIAEQYADRIWVTNDNPRTEDPDKIVADIMVGFKDPKKVTVQTDRSRAIQDSIHHAKGGDCVLIAGKGAETYQIIGDKKIPFSDVEEVKKCGLAVFARYTT